MKKNLHVCVLFDFYRDLLTDKQADAIDLYYNQDLSLGEIASQLDITRQGVRDNIKRGERLLFDMEEKMGLAKHFTTYRKCLQSLISAADAIAELNRKRFMSKDLSDQVEVLRSVIDELSEDAEMNRKQGSKARKHHGI